ncbi:MAG: hypothetical protein ACBR15_14815 [Microcoleus sp.]
MLSRDDAESLAFRQESWLLWHKLRSIMIASDRVFFGRVFVNLTTWAWGRLGLGVGASILLASATAPNPKTFESFGDWCTKKESLTPEARHTAEVLLSKAKTQECDRAQETLTNLTELSLKSNQIVNLEPLANLTILIILQH